MSEHTSGPGKRSGSLTHLVTEPELATLFTGHATTLAPALLGWHLDVVTDEGVVTVRLTEVEAYGDQGEDPGAHSFRGPTKRNASLFGPPQHTYVYLNYGIHRCLNLACNVEGSAGGVLLRAAEVIAGRDLAVRRRSGKDTGAKLLSGPGRLGQGLGISLNMDAQPVQIGSQQTDTDQGPRFRLLRPEAPSVAPSHPGVSGEARSPAGASAAGVTDRGSEDPPQKQVQNLGSDIDHGPRVGVSGVGGSEQFRWRYWLSGNHSVSAYRAGKNVPR